MKGGFHGFYVKKIGIEAMVAQPLEAKCFKPFKLCLQKSLCESTKARWTSEARPVTVWCSLATPVLTEGLMCESRGEKVYLLNSARARVASSNWLPLFGYNFSDKNGTPIYRQIFGMGEPHAAHQKIKNDHPPEKNVMIF